MSRRVLSLLSLFAVLLPATTAAQRMELTVTGFPIVFPTPTAADFEAGYIESTTTVTFTVDASTGPPTMRTTTVSIACRTPCPSNGGPKAAGTLQWRRADQATWQTLSTTNTPVESQPVQRNSLNDPWSNSIVWRFLLDWDSDPPGALTTFNVVFALTVTTP